MRGVGFTGSRIRSSGRQKCLVQRQQRAGGSKWNTCYSCCRVENAVTCERAYGCSRGQYGPRLLHPTAIFWISGRSGSGGPDYPNRLTTFLKSRFSVRCVQEVRCRQHQSVDLLDLENLRGLGFYHGFRHRLPETIHWLYSEEAKRMRYFVGA